MQITINITDYLKNDKSLTYWSLQRIIVTKIIDECNKSETKKIITNGNLGSVLSDVRDTYFSQEQLNSTGNYTIGTLGGIEIVIDPCMIWDDNRIILTPSLQKKRENKLLRIFREKVTNDTTEIKIIDVIGILNEKT